MKYLILSLKWTKGHDLMTWWGPNDSGYTTSIEKAGHYSQKQIDDKPNFYNDKIDTLAVPLNMANELVIPVIINNQETLRKLVSNGC